MWPNPRVPYELASSRKKLSPPNNKPLIVHVVMNIEYWPFDKNMPRGILPPPHGKVSDPPDLPNYSWVEYGMRVGLPRLIKLLRENDIPVSAFINAQVAEIYPSAFKEVCDLPSISLPYYFKGKLPYSLQLLARNKNDHFLLRISSYFEEILQ